jgi:hypothetical protein
MDNPPDPEWWLKTYVTRARDLETGKEYSKFDLAAELL